MGTFGLSCHLGTDDPYFGSGAKLSALVVSFLFHKQLDSAARMESVPAELCLQMIYLWLWDKTS